MGKSRLVLALGLIGYAAAPATARTLSDADYGFHVSNDPLDTTGEMYRISVRHCRALEEAMIVLHDRHGWLVSIEAPAILYANDIITVNRISTGQTRGQCMRPVEFAVDYSSTDPFVAVQTILDAYNATDPPFTAQVEWCGGNLCVTGASSKSSDGAPVSPERILDTAVTVTGITRRALLDDAVAQVVAATGATISFDPPSALAVFLDEDAGVTPAANIAAREVFAQVVNGYNQQRFEQAWVRRSNEAAADANHEVISKIHGQFIGSAHRQGLPEAEADAQWAVIRSQLETQLARPVEPAPAYTPGLGPGWAWYLNVGYDDAGARGYGLSLRIVNAPDELPWDAKLPGTVPVPGTDADGDGVSDAVDQCAATPAGVLVLWTGCSVAQTCPCDGTWPNTGAYNGCVHDVVDTLVSSEALPKNEKGQYTQTVSESGCTQ